MSTNVFTIGDKYSGMTLIPDIITKSSSQKEVTEQLMQYSDGEKSLTTSYTNAGILCDESFEDKDTLSSSIFLALRAFNKIESLILICGDVETTSQKISIPGTLDTINRKSISDYLANEMLKNDKTVGFSISLKYATSGRPSGYEVYMYNAKGDVTRSKLKAEGKELYETKESLLMDSLKDENGKLYVGYSELQAHKDKIREEIRCWAPKYIVQFYG